MFYLLLLSISEYLSFGWSYLIAATMTTGTLGGYFYGFLKSKIAVAFTVATRVLYGYIYMLLQMESGALLYNLLTTTPMTFDVSTKGVIVTLEVANHSQEEWLKLMIIPELTSYLKSLSGIETIEI